MRRTRKLSDQVKEHSQKESEKKSEYEGDAKQIVSTGSTLLDLAISGGRIGGGGIPAGILVEIFGPESCGKTIMLCEIAGNIQQKGGQIMFRDPEARLDKQFAQLFGLDTNMMNYSQPNTVPEVFEPIRSWDPEPEDAIHGVFADSLAALTTDMELENKDAYGMRRAKEFSEQLRLTCRTIRQKRFIVACSNQIRQKTDAQPFEYQYVSPGGKAIAFYASLRLRCSIPSKIWKKQKIAGKEMKRVIGVETQIEVYKSSVWKPYHVAPLYILFDYGIDDIRANLKFLKEMRGSTKYKLDSSDEELGNSLEMACHNVEIYELESVLKKDVVNLWREIETKFDQERKPKQWQ